MSKRARARPTVTSGHDDDDIKLLKPAKKRVKQADTELSENEVENPALTAPDFRLPIKNGFRMMPVHISESPFIKYWYFREQKSPFQRSGDSSTRDEDEDVPEDARSLFVTNIGPDCSETDIRAVFGVCGEIDVVRFDSLHARIEAPGQPKLASPPLMKPSKGQEQLFQHRNKLGQDGSLVKYPFESHGYALVVFKRQQSLLRALNGLRLDTVREATERGHSSSGVSRWLSEYKAFYLQDKEELQSAVDSFMRDYDKRKRDERKLAEELATVTDEDGWTVVVRRGKKKASQTNSRGKDAVVGTATVSTEALLKRKEKETNKLIENFYRFQKQEEKRKRLDELRRQFEMDKRRIAKIKNTTSNRKFKPT